MFANRKNIINRTWFLGVNETLDSQETRLRFNLLVRSYVHQSTSIYSLGLDITLHVAGMVTNTN